MDSIKWNVRSFQEGDEIEILQLLNNVFKTNRDIDSWRWEFGANGWKSKIISIAYDVRDNRIIGHLAVIPMKLNFLGNPIPIGQAVEGVVHPEYRTLGIFASLGKHCHDQCVSNELQMIYGFPNEYAFPVWISKQSWKRIFYLRYFFKIFAIRGAIYNILKFKISRRFVQSIYTLFLQLEISLKQYALRRKVGSDFHFERSTRVPHQYSNLWKHVKSYQLLSIWKDHTYLRWRYDEKPNCNYEYLYLMHGDEMVALAVLNTKDDTATICEFFLKEREILAGYYFINEMQMHFLRNNFKTLVFVGNDVGLFEYLFKDFKLDRSQFMVFCGRSFKKNILEEYFPFPSNWTITIGDSDTI
jgi:hypothetical protein